MKTNDPLEDKDRPATDPDAADVLPPEPEAQEFLQEKSDWSEDISKYDKDKNDKK